MVKPFPFAEAMKTIIAGAHCKVPADHPVRPVGVQVPATRLSVLAAASTLMNGAVSVLRQRPDRQHRPAVGELAQLRQRQIESTRRCE